MNQANPEPLHTGIGGRLPELRTEEGVSQDQLAARMRRLGIRWTRSTVAKVERGQRLLSIEEWLVLAVALGCRLADLVPLSDSKVAISAEATWHAEAVRQLLAGAGGSSLDMNLLLDFPGRSSNAKRMAPAREHLALMNRIWPDVPFEEWLAATDAAHGEAERRIARRLGLDPFALTLLARRLWHANLSQERDRRLEAEAASPERAVLGHMTRELVDDLKVEAAKLGLLPKENPA